MTREDLAWQLVHADWCESQGQEDVRHPIVPDAVMCEECGGQGQVAEDGRLAAVLPDPNRTTSATGLTQRLEKSTEPGPCGLCGGIVSAIGLYHNRRR